MNDLVTETATALKEEWGLILPDTLSEEAILKLLADRVVDILEKGPDTFYQLMYRIDISEKKLNAILGGDHMADKIARLIYDRQLQKIQSRREHAARSTKTEDDEMKW